MHREKKEQKYSKNEINTKDINITQMMVGKQWVKSWNMYRWAGEASTQVKEASSNKGYEEETEWESNAFDFNTFSLQKL